MNVLVWQSYGNINVIVAETVPQVQYILTRVGAAMTGWGNDEELLSLVDSLNKMTPAQARRNADNIVNRLGRGHEAFETFEFTEVEGVK